MDKKDMPAFSKLLSVIAKYYQPLSQTVRRIYWEGLKPFSLLDVRRAFWKHIHSPKEGKFMPKIADFVRYIEGTAETRAMLAWAKIERAMKDVGGYESIVFDDPVIHAVIRYLGGWIKLCQTKTHELPFIAKEFEKLYGHYASRTHSFVPSIPPLCGIFEHENNLQGYDSQPPVSIESSKTPYPQSQLKSLQKKEAAQGKEDEKEKKEKKEREKSDE